MDNNNRYEEVPQKENIFKKGLKTFGNYLKGVAVDFVNSFKYNNMKAAAIFVALPGIFLGFFLSSHIPTAMNIYDSFTKNGGAHEEYTIQKVDGKDEYKITRNDDLIELSFYSSEVKSKDSNYGKTDESSTLTPLEVVGSQTLSYDADKNQFVFVTDYESADPDQIKNYAGYYINIFKDNVLVDSYLTTSANATFDNSTLPNGSYKYEIAIFPTNDAADNYTTSAYSNAQNINISASKVADSVLTFSKYAGVYKGKTSDDNDIILLLKSASSERDVDLTGSVKTVGDATITVNGSETVANFSIDGNNLTCYLKLTVKILPFDYSAMVIFALMLLGFLNVFISLSLSKLKNFGSVMKATVVSALIILLGVAYIYAIFATQGYISSGELIIEGLKDGTIIDKDAIISITVVIISMVSVVIGLILSFINYDRTYEKVDR